MKAFRLALVLVSLITGCAVVTVKKPAGDKPAELDPALWSGSWIGADSAKCAMRILDEKKSVVEFRGKQPDEREDVVTLTVNELGDRLVATVKETEDESCLFFRIAISNDHLALFMPNEKLLKEAVEKGLLAGRVIKPERPKDPKAMPIGGDQTILEQFGSAEAGKLGGVLQCFEPDPGLVYIREKAPPPPAAKPKKSERRK